MFSEDYRRGVCVDDLDNGIEMNATDSTKIPYNSELRLSLHLGKVLGKVLSAK